jgi:phospholipid-binding lipoprotein MlaA
MRNRVKKQESFIRRIGIKALALSIICMTAMTAGCAASHKSSAGRTANASDRPAAASDADFDVLEFNMLEEEFSNQSIPVIDPIEPWNRLMYHVNDGLYFWILKPAAQGYKAVVPEPGRIGIRNFFHNLATPVRFVGCLLQGKGHSAGAELHRFAINTTVGVLGFGDPALDRWKIEPATEDMGQTLAVHGMGNGFYIVWPLLGPSSARDSVGMAGDLFLNPVYYVKPAETAIGISTVNVTNKTSFHIGEYEDFKAAAIDPYIAMREAYIQYRQKQFQK